MKKIIFFSLLFFLLSCNNSRDNIFDLSFKLIPVKEGDNWGYISQDGKFAVNPQFKQAYSFREGMALIKSADGKYGYIDESGKIVIAPQYKYASVFSEGMAAVTRPDQKIEFIDKTGKSVFTLDESIEKADPFNEGMARVEVNDKYGFINKQGKLVVSPQYDNADIFSEGLAPVETKVGDKLKHGFIDKDGKVVISPQFDGADPFFDDRALIKIDTSYGYIDKQGRIVITPQYGEAFEFTENYAAVKQGDLWGFIDKDGKMVISPQFKFVYPFTSSGLGVVQSTSNSKYGAIDRSGKMVINPQYDNIIGFYDHVAIIKQDDKYGLIDDKGKPLVTAIYKDAEPYPLEAFEGQVQNDYFSVSYISDVIYKDLTTSSARGIDKNMTFAGMQQKFPGFSHDNYYDYTLAADDGNKALALSKISIVPGVGFITYATDPANTSSDLEKIYHDDITVAAVGYTYTLKGKAYDERDHIIQQLKDKKPGVFTQELVNDHTLVLYGSGYNVIVSLNNDELALLTYFDKSTFDDFKKALITPQRQY